MALFMGGGPHLNIYNSMTQLLSVHLPLLNKLRGRLTGNLTLPECHLLAVGSGFESFPSIRTLLHHPILQVAENGEKHILVTISYYLSL